MTQTFDIVVVGSALTGLTATMALSGVARDHGLSIALIGPINDGSDGRTTALLMPSVESLTRIGVWEDIEPHCAPLKTMRLVDGSRRLLRAPLTEFRASEIDLDAFGYNAPNGLTCKALEARLAEEDTVTRFDAMLTEARIEGDLVHLVLEDGTGLEAKFVAAADGRNSIIRKAAGIGVRRWTYPQAAIVMNLRHSLPHDGISTEFHTETGPFTFVPLPASDDAANRSSLVWLVEPDQVDDLLAMPKADLAARIQEKMQSLLGRIEIENDPQTFPMEGLVAHRFATGSVALLGETAHVFPPIGAQGFNLGLRDVEALTAAFSGGRFNALRFNANRAADVVTRTGAVDLLNRSLLTDFLPVQAARGAALSAVNHLPWLRRQLMRHGLGARVA